ncbi:ATP-binding protein [Acrocarpospora corrugata]|uniref:ATP-binding protein n=1 Tax=Acrocarpospora corrugata TaxID=35763 RepID=UPI001C3F7786|nr:ATP-binding protein [Acrocarpospora corrugata]
MSWPAPASCALRAGAGSASVARRFAVQTLREWGLSQVADDVQLVVSELVTNALRHALPDETPTGISTGISTGASAGGSVAPVQLRLINQSVHVACAVRDPSERVPLMCPEDDFAESGRGLLLVQELSLTWGWTILRGNGKVVWAIFTVPD